jgi:hypothetical protein
MARTAALGSAALIEAIRKTPGITSTEISAMFGVRIEQASGECGRLFKQGRLTRQRVYMPTGTPKYAYYVVETEVATFSTRIAKPKASKARETTPKGTLPMQSLEGVIDQMASALADMFVVKVKEQFAVKLAALNPESIIPRIALPTPEEVVARQTPKQEQAAARRKKVVVTCLLPQQAGLIQKEYCDCFDIEFWETNSGFDRLRQLAKHADHVFCHVNHARHSVEETVKSVGVNYTRVPGGMSQLRDALTKFYVEATSAA